MGFRQSDILAHTMQFNSASSAELIDIYEKKVDSEIESEATDRPSHRTFAPSAFRCDRLSWFRIRGVAKDKIKLPDRGLDFTAKVGTALHELVQKRLSEALGDDWLDVSEYLLQNKGPYECETNKNGYETQVAITNPPVRFACDGLVRINGKVFILEIKTSEFSTFQDLTEPKEKHVDQIRCYSTLLNIPDVLVLYVDRQYGSMKCFEKHFTVNDHDYVKDKMQHVLHMVEANLAPDKLLTGSSECSPNMCPYYQKCKEW